jgi:hypothetical protein
VPPPLLLLHGPAPQKCPKKIFEQKGSCLPFKYLNRPIHAFVKQLLHHVASVESTSQKKKSKTAPAKSVHTL